MSSYKARTALGAVAIGLAVSLAGCGYEPLYARSDSRPGVVAELASVRVAPIADRRGQILHNLLTHRLSSPGSQGQPAYRLAVVLNERKVEVGIRRDEVATRANLVLTADFVLTEVDSGDTALTGRATSTSSYNILLNDFATLSAEKDARERGIQQLSEDIQTRLAVFLRGRNTARTGQP